MNFCYLIFGLYFFSLTWKESNGAGLNLVVKDVSANVINLEVSWILTYPFSNIIVEWESITYASDTHYKHIGQATPSLNTTKVVISEGLKQSQPYRICLTATEEKFNLKTILCSSTRIPASSKSDQGPPLYIVVGPVESGQATITWSHLPSPRGSKPEGRGDVGYHLEWRKIDGRVGHPGHASTVISNLHIINGLSPNTRFEVCIGESLGWKDRQTCDYFTTTEDVPGPPYSRASTCSEQARGTHWRCDVTWVTPRKPHGRIRGYFVEWKDEEGFTLFESTPRGALCDPLCFDDQILNFHPYEVCVKARTNVGFGWESCVKVEDISTRILAFFELKVILIIMSTILIYQLGPKFLRALLRFCIRTLYKRLETEKKHPV